MAKFLVTYDLKETSPDPHGEFLEQAAKLNWHPWRLINNTFYRLPNTTLFGEFENIDKANTEFQKIWTATRATGYAVTAEKWILVEYKNAKIDSDHKVQNSS